MGMLQDMLPILPLPTLILLKVSGFLHRYWIWVLLGVIGAVAGVWRYVHSPRGADAWDKMKLRLPLIGGVFRAAALSRFARTLGTLVKSGVSLLPSLKIVESTIGNRILAQQIARVAEETRGGDSLAAPLRKLGIFPGTAVQMIDVGEETGRLDEMLLKVAEIGGTPHASANQDVDFPAGADSDLSGGRGGRVHGDCFITAHLQDEPSDPLSGG